jgi:hypothetical protein
MKKFLALFMGSLAEDRPGPGDMSQERIAEGMAAWGAWMHRHAGVIVDSGGPLGTTKRSAMEGVSDIRNAVAGYVIVQAESHDAAAKLFLNHPHYTIFPGEAVEIMECLPIPTAHGAD